MKVTNLEVPLISFVRNIAAAFTLGLAIGAPIGMASAASSDHRTFDGVITHISTENIKVKGMEGGKMQTISFLYKPHIGKLTHNGGKITRDQKMLHVGEYVRVTFDQKLLGLRHADSVDPYGAPGMVMRN